MNTTMNASVDKLGRFHSCDRETYKKLKKVRFFRHVERLQQNRHNRWSRKEPQNRLRFKKIESGIKPTNGGKLVYRNNLPWEATPWPEPELCPLNLDLMEQEYQQAKVQYSDAQNVPKMRIDPQALDAMIATLYDWSDRVYGRRS